MKTTTIKKIMSFTLLAILLVQLSILPAYAADTEPSLSARNFAEIISEKKIDVEPDLGIYITEKVYNTGEVLLTMCVRNTLISEVHIDKESHTITHLAHKSSGDVVSTRSYTPQSTHISPMYAVGHPNYMGRITYRVYSQGVATGYNYLDASYCYGSGVEPEYNFAGQYKDLLDLAATLISVFDLGAAVATQVGKMILQIIDISSTATDFIVPVMVVKANYQEFDWRATNPHNTSMTATLVGIKYEFRFNGSNPHVQYEGSYYPASAYTKHNETFAIALFDRVYPYYDDCDVTAWS